MSVAVPSCPEQYSQRKAVPSMTDWAESRRGQGVRCVRYATWATSLAQRRKGLQRESFIQAKDRNVQNSCLASHVGSEYPEIHVHS